MTEIVFGMEVEPLDLLTPDEQEEDDSRLWVYLQTAEKYLGDIPVWDTAVPAVTEPWPTLEPVSLRDAYRLILGTEDVTGRLYDLKDLTVLLETVKDTPACTNCDKPDCTDKWCGLRGDIDE